jgi:hypothetical protein
VSWFVHIVSNRDSFSRIFTLVAAFQGENGLDALNHDMNDFHESMLSVV